VRRGCRDTATLLSVEVELKEKDHDADQCFFFVFPPHAAGGFFQHADLSPNQSLCSPAYCHFGQRKSKPAVNTPQATRLGQGSVLFSTQRHRATRRIWAVITKLTTVRGMTKSPMAGAQAVHVGFMQRHRADRHASARKERIRRHAQDGTLPDLKRRIDNYTSPGDSHAGRLTFTDSALSLSKKRSQPCFESFLRP
jgi:hypothetical protein